MEQLLSRLIYLLRVYGGEAIIFGYFGTIILLGIGGLLYRSKMGLIKSCIATANSLVLFAALASAIEILLQLLDIFTAYYGQVNYTRIAFVQNGRIGWRLVVVRVLCLLPLCFLCKKTRHNIWFTLLVWTGIGVCYFLYPWLSIVWSNAHTGKVVNYGEMLISCGLLAMLPFLVPTLYFSVATIAVNYVRRKIKKHKS
ncbi:MAG: hypothetical protein QM642_02390 [Edaphocola sp.]